MKNTSKETTLYPLVFKPIFKEKIWGGTRLSTVLNKDCAHITNCGESWELSEVKGDVSIISNGVFAGESFSTIIQSYPQELLGNKVYQKYGKNFPLLIKFIDANKDLSIQVHPNDELALARHNCMGKSEMWYLVDSLPNTSLISGFSKTSNQEEYLKHLEAGTLSDILHQEKVKKGDIFYIPAGRVHTIGKGCLIAEIQQTSDVTYRIYDFNRKDKNGNTRELHTELALEAIDYTKHSQYKTDYTDKLNEKTLVVEAPYFTTNKLRFNQEVILSYDELDSFVALTCVEGGFTLTTPTSKDKITAGQVVLIPASINQVSLSPLGEASVLETYI